MRGLARGGGDQAEPLQGARGGIVGILGAYLLLFPRANILTLTMVWRSSLIVRIPALLVIGVWLLTEFASLMPANVDGGGDASLAHLGGFLAGLLLAPVLRGPGVSLLQPARTAAFSSVPCRSLGSRDGRGSVSSGT